MSASDIDGTFFHLPTFSLNLLESLALDLFRCKKCNRIPRDALICPLCQTLFCNEPNEGNRCFINKKSKKRYDSDDEETICPHKSCGRCVLISLSPREHWILKSFSQLTQ